MEIKIVRIIMSKKEGKSNIGEDECKMLIINNRSFEEEVYKMDQALREQELFMKRFVSFGRKHELKDIRKSCEKVLASIDVIEKEYERLEEKP